MAKLDLKKVHREAYAPPRTPVLADIPELAYLMVDGHGDPNTSPEYARAVEALFSLSYAAKFALKGRPDGLDYVVMPLEGLWWAEDMSAFTGRDKSAWDWTMMIAQPDAVTAEILHEARAKAATKVAPEVLESVRLERFAEARVGQVMHIGPYDDEAPTIAGLHAYIEAAGHALSGKHHEIYLSDPRRAAPATMRTIIRQPAVPV